ncbi:hypothetical protein [Aeromonas caviae]|uniref:hypothetical protein n=1 Tax=Aeromonas caviae TaxID=648 RepID=UPI001F4DE00D|nr:hypothetical protein [Aeromonas caviae]
MLDNPQVVAVDKQNSTADTVSHTVYPVEQKRKRELLSELIGKQNWQQVLVFASTRESCDELVRSSTSTASSLPWYTVTGPGEPSPRLA